MTELSGGGERWRLLAAPRTGPPLCVCLFAHKALMRETQAEQIIKGMEGTMDSRRADQSRGDKHATEPRTNKLF